MCYWTVIIIVFQYFICWDIYGFHSQKNKYRNKKVRSQLGECLYDFTVGNYPNEDIAQNKTVGPQTSGIVKKLGKSTVSENSANHD